MRLRPPLRLQPLLKGLSLSKGAHGSRDGRAGQRTAPLIPRRRVEAAQRADAEGRAARVEVVGEAVDVAAAEGLRVRQMAVAPMAGGEEDGGGGAVVRATEGPEPTTGLDETPAAVARRQGHAVASRRGTRRDRGEIAARSREIAARPMRDRCEIEARSWPDRGEHAAAGMHR